MYIKIIKNKKQMFLLKKKKHKRICGRKKGGTWMESKMNTKAVFWKNTTK